MTATEFIFALIWLALAACLAMMVFAHWSHRRSRGGAGGSAHVTGEDSVAIGGQGGNYEGAYQTALAHIDALEKMVLAHSQILEANKRHLVAHDEHLRLLSKDMLRKSEMP